jgi:hypothetical protein
MGRPLSCARPSIGIFRGCQCLRWKLCPELDAVRPDRLEYCFVEEKFVCNGKF